MNSIKWNRTIGSFSKPVINLAFIAILLTIVLPQKNWISWILLVVTGIYAIHLILDVFSSINRSILLTGDSIVISSALPKKFKFELDQIKQIERDEKQLLVHFRKVILKFYRREFSAEDWQLLNESIGPSRSARDYHCVA